MANSNSSALVTVDDHQALTARIDMPIWGAWTGSFETDADAPPAVGDLVTILIAPQTTKGIKALFLGTVIWNGAWQGRSRFEVMGGTAGLRRVLPARSYAQGPLPIPLGSVLADLVGEADETLAPGVQSTRSADPYMLPRWPRCAATGLASIGRLCRRFGLVWRVLDDGTIFVGPASFAQDQTYATTAPTQLAVDEGDNGQLRVIRVAPDSATLRPDTTVLGKPVTRVVYELDEDGLRADLYYPTPDGKTDRDDYETAVRTVLPELPYMAGRAAMITAVRANGRVEVRADDDTIGAVDSVVMLSGLPESKITPLLGQQVRLYFSEADPRFAYAIAWEQDEGAAKSVARVGDTVDSGTLTATAPPGGGPVVFTYTSPDGTAGPAATAASLAGVITSGHPRIKLT